MSPNLYERRVAKIALLITALLIATMAATMVVGPASAQTDPYNGGSPTIIGTITNTGTPPEEILPSRHTNIPPPDIQPNRSGLPFTGADVTLFAATGLALVGTGSLLWRRTRRRP